MKRKITPLVMLVGIAIGMSLAFSSCDDDDWYPGGPPTGWTNTFYDRYLAGSWQLIQVNSKPVNGDATNYLYFDNYGRGRYYYYQNGDLYSERIAYWCQDFFGSNKTEINIKYENGQASTMDYWFTDNYHTLWMSWQTSQGTVTYLYDYIGTIP